MGAFAGCDLEDPVVRLLSKRTPVTNLVSYLDNKPHFNNYAVYPPVL